MITLKHVVAMDDGPELREIEISEITSAKYVAMRIADQAEEGASERYHWILFRTVNGNPRLVAEIIDPDVLAVELDLEAVYSIAVRR